MGCEESFITMKLIWHSYLVPSLDNYTIKLCTETSLMIYEWPSKKRKVKVSQWKCPCQQVLLCSESNLLKTTCNQQINSSRDGVLNKRQLHFKAIKEMPPDPYSLWASVEQSTAQAHRLENRLWEPVGNGFRHRFSNQFPPTETNDLVLGHPLVPVGKSNWYQRGCHTDARWQPLWYRLVFPTGTNDFFPFFPNPVLFVIFIIIYSFIIAKRTRALQYYTFIGRSFLFSFSERNVSI